jgi:hypothetical protein
MGTIKQATYGDEDTSTDITDSLVNMFKRGNRAIDVQVGPQLLQTKEKGGKVEINSAEDEEIRKKALESCGNGLDEACMKTTQDSLRQSKLEEKSRQAASEPIVGERLTVTVVDKLGKEKTLVIPKDKQFTFGKELSPQEQKMAKFRDELMKIFSFEKLGGAAGTALMAFIWVFGTAFAWVALSRSITLPNGDVINPSEYWWLKWVGAIYGAMTAGWGGFYAVIISWLVLGIKYYVFQRSLALASK